MARALRKPDDAHNQALKPQPAGDLWERMEVELKKLSEYTPPKPPNSFTSPEFMERFKLTENQATRRLRNLQAAGKVRRYGHSGRHVYYIFSENGFPDDGQPKPGPKPIR